MNRPPRKRVPPPPKRATEVLVRLTALAQELAGAFRPATVVELVASAVTEMLAPGRLTIVLLDAGSNSLAIAHHAGGEPPHTADPLIQLALRRGPLVFSRDVARRAQALGVSLPSPPSPPTPPSRTLPAGRGTKWRTADAPASWIGAPIVAVGRPIGALSIGSESPGAYARPHLLLASAVAAQAAIALENTRLMELLSSGKREWELTVDVITHAICIVDAHGVVRRANRFLADLIHLPVTALPGRPWLGLFPPTWADVVARALAHPGGADLHEIRAGDRILLVSAIPMAGTDAGSAVLMFEDHTEKRRLQEQLIQSEKMSAIGQLIAGVAHDLNNPLTSVVGFSDFLSESGEVPAALAEPLQVIRQEAERAANIVKNLLSFARRQQEERHVQPIQPILESTLALLRNELMARKVEATLEVEPGLSEVEVNANQIKQVFVNLINNAAQAIAGAGRLGRVTVTARKWLDGIAVGVGDDGPGMPEAVAARVFEPFYTTKPEGEGTGLGLSICQGIVKEHGGRITLETSPDAGATFTVELPGGTRAARISASHAAPEAGGRLRILVVDDEPHILHYLRATLESWGHAVELASDGTEALARALEEPFDVIICDLRMPRLGGREVFHGLRHEHPEVADRIIFATGDTVRGDTLAFLEGLKRPYLHKPFTLAELRSVLRGIVQRAS